MVKIDGFRSPNLQFSVTDKRNMVDYAVELYKLQIEQRKAIIQSINPEAGFPDFYPVIVPEVMWKIINWLGIY